MKKIDLAKGAYCPKCGGNTRVIRSKRIKRMSDVRRRRHCVVCGNRFTTREIPNEEYKELNRCRKYAAEVARMIRKNIWRLNISLPLRERTATSTLRQAASPSNSESGTTKSPEK